MEMGNENNQIDESEQPIDDNQNGAMEETNDHQTNEPLEQPTEPPAENNEINWNKITNRDFNTIGSR